MQSTAALTQRKAFLRKRWSVFGVLICAYVMVYFHRFAPGVVSDELRESFGLTAASLGSLAAVYFYVYALMQVPSGILADSLGPRKTVFTGNLLAGLGSILFGLAQNLAMANAGRFLVGLGVSVIFVAVMKSNANWFSERMYGRMSGLTLLIGNVGSVLAASPLALLVIYLSWRNVFAAIGVLSILLAVVSYLVVRDRPEQCGFPPVSSGTPHAKNSLKQVIGSLVEVGRRRSTWAIFIMNFGVTGGLYAFMGLWGMRLFCEAHTMTEARASGLITAMLLSFAVGCVFFGWLSDKILLRKAVLVWGNLGYLLGWLIFWWWMPSSMIVLYPLMLALGLLGGASTLGFATSKESNHPRFPGMAVAVVNMGTFVGVSLMQPLYGWTLDKLWKGQMEGELRLYGFSEFQDATLLLVAFAFLAFVASLFVHETRCQNLLLTESSNSAPFRCSQVNPN